jgi:hypothetical protein
MNLKLPKKKSILIPNNKKDVKIKWWHKLIFLSPIFLIAILFKANDWYNAYLLSNYKDSTWAEITKVTLSGARESFDIENVEFRYTVNDSTYISYVSVPINYRFVISDINLPVFSGQKYKLYYSFKKPSICKIDFTQPDTFTIVLFIKDVSNIVKYILQNVSIEQAYCIALSIYTKYKYNGLAYLYFHDEYLVENFAYNSFTFQKFWNSPEIKSIINNCLIKYKIIESKK